MVDEQKLRQLAEAATPGPWRPSMDGVVTNPEHGPTRVVLSANVIDDQRAKDCSYVAALHPAAILSLLDELQAMREERTAWCVTAENAEKDAARYRWIRFAALSEDQSSIFEALESADPDPKSYAEFDAAIDAAMKDES